MDTLSEVGSPVLSWEGSALSGRHRNGHKQHRLKVVAFDWRYLRAIAGERAPFPWLGYVIVSVLSLVLFQALPKKGAVLVLKAGSVVTLEGEIPCLKVAQLLFEEGKKF